MYRTQEFDNQLPFGRQSTLKTCNPVGDLAVYIKDACKCYQGGPPILENFCMNVKTGTVYGLLGSSGCGKTTILSCIVGLKRCDFGEILVFGREPGTKGSGIPGKRLGYMPQELALYNHLTVREIIQFYGRVYSMNNTEIKEQWSFLNSLLKLPSNSKIIAELSGGQQRRVSLALALIHSPRLLILDEPTVGLDPLLRKDIWVYLYKICQKLGTTIILTTHYIEEARNSNTIGVMRNGRLLVEDTPSNLLRDYNCLLLEQVVLQLCREDALNPINVNSVQLSQVSHSATENYIHEGVDHHRAGTSLQAVEVNGEIVSEHFATNVNNIVNAGISAEKDKKITNYGFLHTWQRIYGFTIVILMTFIRNPVKINKAPSAFQEMQQSLVSAPWETQNGEKALRVDHSIVSSSFLPPTDLASMYASR